MKNILSVLIIGLVFMACESPNKKEIEEVNALLTIASDTEKMLLSVDTASVFKIKKIMGEDFKRLSSFSDTLKKEEAFRIADIFGSKKKVFRMAKNYVGYFTQLSLSKKQLSNLKKDLENGLLKDGKFQGYYESEQSVLMKLNADINKYANGMDAAIGKYELERPELLELLEKRKLRATNNE